MSYIFTSPTSLSFVEDTPVIDHYDKRRELLQSDISIDGNDPAEILFITSYPPVECGIATYSQDLIKALTNKFSDSFTIRICALESGTSNHDYPDEVSYILDTNNEEEYTRLALAVNQNEQIQTIFIQHEFGFFRNTTEKNFLKFLYILNKPIVIVFHTVLPTPDEVLYLKVQRIAAVCDSVVVMTNNSSQLLINDYHLRKEKVTVIPHGTHLVRHTNKDLLKEIYGLKGRKVLSTFGLLSSGKSIETTLNALPAIVKTNPDVIFLIIGKTHPGVLRSEGERYRRMLEDKVEALHLHHHVKFINYYLPLEDLLEYLQLTDIYLFTSKDPNQAVSGTFAYAMSCACPIISTPIPHAREVLRDDTGIIVDFQNPIQLTAAIEHLLNDNTLLKAFSSNTLQRIIPSAWENSAIAHARLLEKVSKGKIPLHYRLPEINLAHVKKMTTDFAMFQFSSFNQPDIDSGYTLDDNARALIAICMHYELTGDVNDIPYLRIYLNFIQYCQQPDGQFLNYTDVDSKFTEQNNETNLSDSNGRAVWALGYLISQNLLLPSDLVSTAESVIQKAIPYLERTHSTRSMAFAIKGLYYYNRKAKSAGTKLLIKKLANRLVQMYRHESEPNWLWFESYLTYANSILPEALLCAWLETGEELYKDIAKESFDFLLANTFNKEGIKLISNRSWLHKGKDAEEFGEQPIDVAYTILALNRFYTVFEEDEYVYKLETAFNWFLGNNHLHQIIYNPCTGGCYDGLEENHVNLNQGAESTLSYLMARLTIEKRFYKGRRF
jgi:glycosyltransferase involved in cell wall biosynthesis